VDDEILAAPAAESRREDMTDSATAHSDGTPDTAEIRDLVRAVVESSPDLDVHAFT